MAPEISRRTFLLGTAGLAALVACGDDDPDVSVPRSSSTTEATGAASKLSLVIGSQLVTAGFEERVAFAVLEGSPPRPAKGGPEVKASFTKVGGGALGSEAAVARYHHEGIEERPYWEVRRTFSEPGNYVMKVHYDGRPVEAGMKVHAPGELKAPANGQPLPVVPTPTTADARGVDPICTRKPPCELHALSLDAALAQKKPLIVLLSTPALCQSAICGPVLDVLLDAKPLYDGKANAIHIEVYKDLTGQTPSDGFKAFNLQVEPVFYFVTPDGKVKERLDGPVDKVDLSEAITRLLS
jgi:hypothetical protein